MELLVKRSDYENWIPDLLRLYGVNGCRVISPDMSIDNGEELVVVSVPLSQEQRVNFDAAELWVMDNDWPADPKAWSEEQLVEYKLKFL